MLPCDNVQYELHSYCTLCIGAYSQIGAPASYDEPCSAKFTVAYVENTFNENLQVVSTLYIDMNIEHELFMCIFIPYMSQ